MNDPQGVSLDRTRARLFLCGADKGSNALVNTRKGDQQMSLPKSVLLPLDVVLDISKYLFEQDDFEAIRLGDILEAKLRSLIAREEYTQRINAEKGSR